MLWENCIYELFKETEIKKNTKMNSKLRSITAEERDAAIKEFISKSKIDFIKQFKIYRIRSNQMKEGNSNASQNQNIIKKANTKNSLFLKFPDPSKLPTHKQFIEIILKLVEKKR